MIRAKLRVFGRVQTRAITEDSAILDLSQHDVAEQRLTSQIITLDGQGMHLRPGALRYSWPGELDLMADRAGLRLQERHSDWHRGPFTSSSGAHVSVTGEPDQLTRWKPVQRVK
jgi:hypothetical protein